MPQGKSNSKKLSRIRTPNLCKFFFLAAKQWSMVYFNFHVRVNVHDTNVEFLTPRLAEFEI